MRPSLLIIVTTDPAVSGRPAEAIRIAAGVGTWKKVDVSLYFRGSSIASLGEWVDELTDEDNFTRYLPIAAEGGGRIFVEAGNPRLNQLGEPSVRFTEITEMGLARLIRNTTYTLRF